MDENKWRILFNYGKGKGMYFVVVFPYIFTLLIMYPLSMLWFNLIHFEDRMLGSLGVIIILSISLIFKLPKLKERINNIYQ